MAEFISTFMTGFQKVIAADLPRRLGGCRVLAVYDGLVHYGYDGDSRRLGEIPYFNNTFFVLKVQKGKGLNFPSLVGAVTASKKYFLINRGTFRVRFVRENQFAKVDKGLARRAESDVLASSRLRVDRLSPDTEIWYVIRREGLAFCGQLLFKRAFTEKNLHKGELRPEIAWLVCRFADAPADGVLCDPFCGYGAIAVQLASQFPFARLYASDIDGEKIALVRQKETLKKDDRADVFVSDAFRLPEIADCSVDCIITDPPWGFFEETGDITDFYRRMLRSFRRIVRPGGSAVILSARTEELEAAARAQELILEDSLHTLVNGKKASVYKFRFG